MYNHRQLIIIYICIFRFFVYSSTSQHQGHLKPFGSSGPFKKIDELRDGFPDPIIFFNKYISKSHPVLFRQALINDVNLSLWNKDENLNKIFSNNNEIVHVETRKKESRKQDILTMTMTEFLKRYQYEELYLVAEVPNLLRSYFTLPTSLQCKPAIDAFQVAMLWFSSGNTSSVAHTDDYDNINCVLQGDKQFVLLDPHAHKEVASEIIDNYSGSYSSIDVDSVDYNKYPSLDNNNIHYYQVTLSKGDCLFIPSLWIHQVRSNNRNIAVNYWLNHKRAKNAVVNENTCLLMNKSNFMRLDTIEWPKEEPNIEHLKNLMLDLVDEGKTNFKQWTNEFSKDLDFDLRSNVETITLFAEFFNIVDANENGFITINEVESLSDYNKITAAYDIIEDILDIVDANLDQTNQSNNISINNIDDEMYNNNHRINETFSGDETGEEEEEEEGEEEDNDYIDGHDEL
ncbi:unnamed protein product [Rotaria sordida]|uniref:JmjC domain-containing protein n=1 Tax=Rotaria sordida TaxID=392033 RepID=A0A818UC76_9BILA|nr:unnamed protein product [Rotaria sordida]CAF3695047.1 unnamed protein product [Rotaria sordida]